MRRHRALLWVMLGAQAAIVAGGPAGAQEQPAETAPRYVFVPVKDGALRLNTGTGEVSLCAGAGGAGTCTLLPDEAHDREAAANAWHDRIARLEARMAQLEARIPAGEALSDEESMDRVMLLADRMMRRFFALVRDIKEDVERDEL